MSDIDELERDVDQIEQSVRGILDILAAQVDAMRKIRDAADEYMEVVAKVSVEQIHD